MPQSPTRPRRPSSSFPSPTQVSVAAFSTSRRGASSGWRWSPSLSSSVATASPPSTAHGAGSTPSAVGMAPRRSPFSSPFPSHHLPYFFLVFSFGRRLGIRRQVSRLFCKKRMDPPWALEKRSIPPIHSHPPRIPPTSFGPVPCTGQPNPIIKSLAPTLPPACVSFSNVMCDQNKVPTGTKCPPTASSNT